MSDLPGGRFHDPGNGGGLRLPVTRVALEAGAPLRGQGVIAAAAIVLGLAPFALDVAVALETAESREQGAGVHLEDALADLLQPHADAVAVHRLERQRLQD